VTARQFRMMRYIQHHQVTFAGLGRWDQRTLSSLLYHRWITGYRFILTERGEAAMAEYLTGGVPRRRFNGELANSVKKYLRRLPHGAGKVLQMRRAS